MKKFAVLAIALFSAVAFAQDLPQIAVYVTGGDDGGRNRALGKLLLTSLAQSGRYKAVEQAGTFFNEVAEHDKSRGGAIDYGQVREIGKRYGASLLCIAEVAPSAGAVRVSARIINLESLATVAAGEADTPLETLADATEAARLITAALHTDTPPPTAATDTPTPATAPARPEPEPAPATQDPPNIAVYVTGGVGDDEKKALGTHMLAALVNSGRYKGIERSSSFLAEIDKEMIKQRSGAIDDSQISELGKQFGVKFICIADITPVYGGFQVSARVVNVETAEVALIGQATSPLQTIDDFTKVSDKAVRRMFGQPDPPDPDSLREHGIKMSAGGGGFLASDLGGGLQWANGEQLAMPYSGGGMYLYIDAEYAEAFIGYSAGNGKWESADVSNQNRLPDMQRAYLNFGVFLKYPFSIMGRAKLFPILGADYELSTSASLKPAGGNVYAFDGADNHPDANALSALWVKFGAGVDYGLGRTLYLRAELLYGIRTAANSFEKERANAEKAKYPDGVKTMPGNGITFKTGVGVKL